MIYMCTSCRQTTFSINCTSCFSDEDKTLVPLDAAFYPDFHYESKGFVKDLFGKKKEQTELNNLLQSVLTKYSELLDPYFINFCHIVLSDGDNSGDAKTYSQLELFKEVLVRKGFTELSNRSDLLDKLLLTTNFASTYFGFKKEVSRHIHSDLVSSLRSWIEESGTNFRQNLCLFLYYIWEAKADFEVTGFNSNAKDDRETPLVDSHLVSHWMRESEAIYRDILVIRLDSKLANFDPKKFITIYLVDAMDGFEFEDFLVILFQTIGYDVKETKKTGDQGADLFVERFGKKTVIQAKNYSGSVGNAAVQQVLAAKTFYSCDEAMVVTNSYFTKSAKELAASSSVRLIDRNNFINYLDDYNQQLIDKIEV